MTVKTQILVNICNILDAPRPWGLYFQDSATPRMEGLAELHNNIMFYLFIILFAVGWILTSIIRNYASIKIAFSHKYLDHGTLIELIWTITPVLILIFIVLPSFKLLYLKDEVSNANMSILCEGHQWYWSYQYPDFLDSDNSFIKFDSFLVSLILLVFMAATEINIMVSVIIRFILNTVYCVTDKFYNFLQLALSYPPKPHPFINLPLQSNIYVFMLYIMTLSTFISVIFGLFLMTFRPHTYKCINLVCIKSRAYKLQWIHIPFITIPGLILVTFGAVQGYNITLIRRTLFICSTTMLLFTLILKIFNWLTKKRLSNIAYKKSNIVYSNLIESFDNLRSSFAKSSISMIIIICYIYIIGPYFGHDNTINWYDILLIFANGLDFLYELAVSLPLSVKLKQLMSAIFSSMHDKHIVGGANYGESNTPNKVNVLFMEGYPSGGGAGNGGPSNGGASNGGQNNSAGNGNSNSVDNSTGRPVRTHSIDSKYWYLETATNAYTKFLAKYPTYIGDNMLSQFKKRESPYMLKSEASDIADYIRNYSENQESIDKKITDEAIRADHNRVVEILNHKESMFNQNKYSADIKVCIEASTIKAKLNSSIKKDIDDWCNKRSGNDT